MATVKMIKYSATVEGAISDGYSALQDLAQEVRDVVDNMPENLQSGSRADALNEAADALEYLTEPSIPDVIKDLPVEFEYKPTPARKMSRRVRRDEATRIIDMAVSSAQSWLDDADDDHPDRDEVETFIQEAEELRDEADNVEFPGMFS